MIARTLLEMSDEETADATGKDRCARARRTEHHSDGSAVRAQGRMLFVPVRLPGKCRSPNYQEYFDTLNKASADNEFKLSFLKQCQLPIEGSRGCFAACDFCGLNSTWTGFRAAPADRVVSQAKELAARHPGPTIFFVDNVCDTWAERYSEQLLKRGLRYEAFMELRAHHPEPFWTKLALAGVNNIQIGVESFSPATSSENGQGNTSSIRTSQSRNTSRNSASSRAPT